MSPKLPQVKCRELVQALKLAGFEEQRQRGSHRILGETHREPTDLMEVRPMPVAEALRTA